MRNLLPVLKKLGKKMTGEDITGKNLVTVVDDIAEKYTGGGGGEGGCDCTFVVRMTMDGNGTILDKTWEEIYDALAAEKRVIIIQNINTDDFISVSIDEVSNVVKVNGVYSVYTAIDHDTVFTANAPSDYPHTNDIN